MDLGGDIFDSERRRRTCDTVLKRVTAGPFCRLINRMTETDMPCDAEDLRWSHFACVMCRMPCPSATGSYAEWWLGFPANRGRTVYDRGARTAGKSNKKALS